MPQYLAKELGFFGTGKTATLYGPGTKRPYVVTDEPLDPIPSWLEPVKDAPVSDEAVLADMTANVNAGVQARQEADREIAAVTFITQPPVGGSIIETF